MKISLAGTLIAVLLLSACSTAVKPLMPSDGGGRIEVNSDAAIRSYVMQASTENHDDARQAQVDRQVEQMHRQVAAMTQYVQLLALNAENAPPSLKPLQLANPAPVRLVSSGETMEVRPQGLVFRASMPEGKSDFTGTTSLQSIMVRAARDARHVEIRARTDSDVETVASRKFVHNAAMSVRNFLVSNGVSPKKISIDNMAAGGFWVDNDTPAGRSRNQRVEIETMDMDTGPYLPPSYKLTSHTASQLLPSATQSAQQ